MYFALHNSTLPDEYGLDSQVPVTLTSELWICEPEMIFLKSFNDKGPGASTDRLYIGQGSSPMHKSMGERQ